MMVELVLYSYAVGVRSSRVIERRCIEDVASRFVAANRAPDHVTINRFRSRHADALSRLFGDVLALCAGAGLVRAGTIAIDSTKMAADASMGENRTYDGLRAEARRILEEAAEIDAAEDARYGEKRGDELPEELANPQTRRARIKELLEGLEAERHAAETAQREKVDRHAEQRRQGLKPAGRPPSKELPKQAADALFARKVNLTDSDSTIVSHRGMLLQGYNVQAAVADGQVILATRATDCATDHGELAAMTEAARGALNAAGIETKIDRVLADSGYWNVDHVRELQADGLDVLVQPRPYKPESTRKSTDPFAAAMANRLASTDGSRSYRRRQQIAEPVFAHIKHLRGITRVLRRGRHAVQAEIDLIATTHNLLKLYRTPPAAA